MPYLNPRILDNGLSALTAEANRLDICSSEPATYAAATGAASLGNVTAYTLGAPADRAPSGRRVTAPAVADGEVTATGTASHWAIVDTANSRLLATGTLSATQAVTSGNTWTTGAFDIGMPGVV